MLFRQKFSGGLQPKHRPYTRNRQGMNPGRLSLLLTKIPGYVAGPSLDLKSNQTSSLPLTLEPEDKGVYGTFCARTQKVRNKGWRSALRKKGLEKRGDKKRGSIACPYLPNCQLHQLGREV